MFNNVFYYICMILLNSKDKNDASATSAVAAMPIPQGFNKKVKLVLLFYIIIYITHLDFHTHYFYCFFIYHFNMIITSIILLYV